jgi:uncharacterized coiled-coil protein SlyX
MSLKGGDEMDIEKRISELERKVSELTLVLKQLGQDLRNASATAQDSGKLISECAERLEAANKEWQKEVTERLEKVEVAAGLAKG